MINGLDVEAFVAIAEERHFLRAADRVGIAQSVASKRLKRLEAQLGLTLIDRENRMDIGLTRAGSLFLPVARETLDQLRRAERLGHDFGRGESGPLRLGYVFSAALTGLLINVIEGLARSRPRLEVRPVLMETPEQLAALEQGIIDVGFLRPRSSYPAWCLNERAHSEGILLGMAKSHGLCDRTSVRASALASEVFVVPQFREDVGLIEHVHNLAKLGGFAQPVVIPTADYITAASMAAAGLGIVLAPASLARLHLKGLGFVGIDDYCPSLEIEMVHRGDVPEPLIADVRAAFGSASPVDAA
ncbi:LysR family transcriptional regulator [Novosphingobium pentaromativorans]|nr:LysR family transcriptional regulator [Novosphingobium pentaromativorans]